MCLACKVEKFLGFTRIFYATDVHGSDVCWSKFLNAAETYKAQCLVLGGDMTGKAVVPIVKKGQNFTFTFAGKGYDLTDESKLEEYRSLIAGAGYYPHVCDESEFNELRTDPKKIDEVFVESEIGKLRSWLALADDRLKNSNVKCVVCPGNDDRFEIDEVFKDTKCVIFGEGKAVSLDDDHEIISCSWTNPSPWDLYREEPEEQLLKRLESYISQVKDVSNCVCNFHDPPFESGLDEAQRLGENLETIYGQTAPVGSTAVRDVILKYQPLTTFHGHIHESRGMQKIGRTICFNPGSSYEQGILQGLVVNIDKKGVKGYYNVQG
jgi:Icc-related predicted phosphoesterase